MKIGIYTEIYKPVLNGVVVSVESFREQLEALGHEVYIFTPAFGDYHDKRVLTFHSLPLPTQTPYRLTTPLRDYREVPAVDVIHAQSLFMTGWLAWSHARRHGLPLVFTYHTRLVDYSHYVPFWQPASKKWLEWMSRTYSNGCDRVVVPTAPIADLLRSYGVSVPIDVVPTPVSLPQPAANPRQEICDKHNVPYQRRLLLNVGRLAEEKNTEMLLEAFAKQPSDCHLLLVGDGQQREHLGNRARQLGVSDRVTFCGLVDRQAIASYYAASDLFVFTSVTETQGLVLDEALQMGLPVVAIAEGGVIDVLRQRAGAVSVEPTADYATALGEALYQLEALREQAGGGRSTPLQQARKLLTVYHAAMATCKRRHPSVPERWLERLRS